MSMVEWSLWLWLAAVGGYVFGTLFHGVEALRYRLYLPTARYPSEVDRWVVDEFMRCLADAILCFWGLLRIMLIDTWNLSPLGTQFDILALALYWSLLA